MITALAALVLSPVAYSLPSGANSTYYVRIGLDGFLPLLGGKEGKAQVDMTIDVQGLAADSQGNPKASSDITAFHLMFNGQEFPLDLESVKQYFPKNTISFTPQGHVLTNDAPDTALPVRLPGLDPKRFPDITYLPIEFPQTGVEEGKSWSFKKPFQGVDLNYTVTPTHVDEGEIDMKIDLTQHDESFEDSSHGLVDSQDKAEAKVVTDLTGGGTAVFDRKKDEIRTVAIKMDSKSTVTSLHTKQVENRSLTTNLDVSLEKALPASASASNSGGGQGLLNLLGNQVEKSGTVQRALVAAQLMHPGDRLRRATAPYVRSAMEHINVPSQDAVVGQFNHFAVLTRQAAIRIPELVNVDRVHQLGRMLSSVPSVIAQHWSPNYEGLNAFAEQLVNDVSPYDAGPAQTTRQGGRKNQHQPRLTPRTVKAGR
jgi:hypothetical protein